MKESANKWTIYDHGDRYEIHYHCPHFRISGSYNYEHDDIKKTMFELKEQLRCEYCEYLDDRVKAGALKGKRKGKGKVIFIN